MRHLHICILLVIIAFTACKKETITPVKEKSFAEQLNDSVISVITKALYYQVNDDNDEQSIFYLPTITFNKTIGNWQTEYFRAFLESGDYTISLPYCLNIKDYSLSTSKNESIKVELSYNSNSKEVIFRPDRNLPPNESFVLEFKCEINIQVDTDSLKLDKTGYLPISYSFNTGTTPRMIAPEDIEYSYPIPYQLNFYKNEYPEGYIKLFRNCNYSYLFQSSANESLIGKLSSENGENIIFPYTYTSNNEIVFNIPVEMKNETGYILKFCKTNENADTVILYETIFRTSKFNSMEEKMDHFNIVASFPLTEKDKMDVYGTMFRGEEYFDHIEQTQLISGEADIDNGFLKFYNELIYSKIPISGHVITWRDTTLFGILPIKAVCLSEIDFHRYDSLGMQVDWKDISVFWKYQVANYVYQDYEIFKEICKKIPESDRDENVTKIINSQISYFRECYDPIYSYLKYSIPGRNIETSKFKVLIRDLDNMKSN